MCVIFFCLFQTFIPLALWKKCDKQKRLTYVDRVSKAHFVLKQTYAQENRKYATF